MQQNGCSEKWSEGCGEGCNTGCRRGAVRVAVRGAVRVAVRGAVRSAVRGGALRVQQGTRWTGGAQAGRGKAEESKVAAAPTVKQTLPQEPAPFRRPPRASVSSLFSPQLVASLDEAVAWLQSVLLIVQLRLKLALSVPTTVAAHYLSLRAGSQLPNKAYQQG